MPRAPSGTHRFHDALLRCYPAAFRDEYGRELRADFARLWRDERSRGVLALAQFVVSVSADTLASAAREHASILRQDLRTSVRSLSRAPAFALGATLTLALGIGATTAVFSVVHAVLLQPLPLAQPERLVELVGTKPLENIDSYSVSAPDFESWRERTRSFTDMAALWGRSVVLTDGIEPERIEGLAVSPNLWTLLGVDALVGRTFDPDRDRPGDKVALISDALFQRRYGGDRTIIGRTIQITGEAHTVVGVVPADLGFTRNVDVWLPWTSDPGRSRGDRQADVIARLKPGIAPGQASAEIASTAAALAREFPLSNRGYGARARPLLEYAVTPGLGRALTLVLVAAGVLLLVACANVANLMLTRALAQRSDLSLRRALGANSARLVRQVVTESLVLAVAGGACGVVLSAATVRIARAALAATLPRAWNISLDLPTLVVACTATTVTGIAFALVPAWLGIKSNLADGLRTHNELSLDRSAARLRQAFIVAQFSMATVLVAAAAMVGQSLQRIMDVDPGFPTDRLLLANLSLPARYPNAETRNTFYHQLLESLAAEPGVESVGLVSRAPLMSGGTGMEVTAAAGSAEPLQGQRAHWRTATSGYFQTMGIPLIRGRLFDSRLRDTQGFRPIVISESLARRLWPDGEDPIDRQVRLANGQTRTVVGVVGDVHQRSLVEGMTPTMYMPTSWAVMGTMSLVVRSTGDPISLSRVVREALRRLDSQVPIFDVHTMDEQRDRTTAQARVNAGLLGTFALIALALGLVGVAGVVAHAVSTRRPELAVRMALGAPAPRIAREVAVEGIQLTIYGIVLGLAGAWLVGRVLSGLLFDVRADDPTVLGGIALALMLVSMLACLLPALRVVRLDPAAVLRRE